MQIAELRDYFDDDPESTGQTNNYESPSAPEPSLLMGSFQRLDRHQILSTLPSKQEVDRLVSEFFNTPNMYLSKMKGRLARVALFALTGQINSYYPRPNILGRGRRLSLTLDENEMLTETNLLVRPILEVSSKDIHNVDWPII